MDFVTTVMLRDHNEFSLKTIFTVCHQLKKNKKKIGFTHGAFDLFHYAHLELLRESAKLCDFFIVCIESDNNIRSYKTYKRPIIKENHRLEILSELNCVNLVFINRSKMNEDIYIELYKECKTDFVTIGDNFGFEDRIQSQTHAAKTKLIKIDTIKESTTKIVNRIIDRYRND